ncbi:helix-turn-helix domain-containing protein [Pararhodobacter sp. CCB-MM2]|uniref:winged helix-turn-helix transcriptional regulator n=1 Tax=Pararhodobacter sp. CCB-MM2 TaxID=1786003 RepID=UPI00082B0B07|nr:helix-turn-helix domain-containing protein [Pararhodobacter sp. CCB-MM2]
MARKGYDEGCLAAHALDLIGDRWALLVLRELMLGPKRFGLIRAGLPGIATNVLTQRLEDLQAAGLLQRQVLPPPSQAAVYALTPAGAATRPILAALCLWGVQQPGHDPRKFISPTALMLSMSFLARANEAAPIDVAFTLGVEPFLARLGADGFTPVSTPAPVAPLHFRGDGNGLAAVIYGPAPLAMMVQSGMVQVDGDLTLGQRFVDHFALR